MNRLLWLCPPLMLIGAFLVSLALGFSILSSILISLLIACPVIIIYGAVRTRTLSKEPPARTRGMPLNWAAPFYDAYCPKIGLGRAFRQRTIELADIRTGHHVLDVGCGTGVLTIIAAKAAGGEGMAVGIDPAPAMIGKARENARKEASRAEFRVAAIEELPFNDSSFDRVLSSLMLHHLPPDVKLKGLAEIKRVLKPDGKLLLVDIGKPTSALWWIIAWPLVLWHFTREQVHGHIPEFLGKAGFREIEKKGGWIRVLEFWSASK
ncbi:MAG TPA: class I SAM-dependent methyltransferase [Thermodesulfobacteriota bacterium]